MLMEDRQNLIQRWHDEGYFGQQTLFDALAQGAELKPDAYLCLESDERPGKVVLGDAFDQSVKLAGALYSLGIRAGDVVAVQLPNWIESALLSQAIWILDAVLLPITSIYTAADLIYILNDANAKALFIPGKWRRRDYRDDIAAVRRDTQVDEIITLAETSPIGGIDWPTFLSLQTDFLPLRRAKSDDTAAIIYTSGTTSRPKGVIHTHNTLLFETQKGVGFYGNERFSNQISPWPFGHIASLISVLRWSIDGVNTLLSDRWDAPFVARIVKQYQIAATTGVPYFLSSMMDAADADGIDISCLKNYGTGAANVPGDLVRDCNERGIHCYRIYGSTEHPTVTSGMPEDSLEKRITTDGRPLPGCEVRIVDDKGNDVPVGVEGEITIIGPEQFICYTRDEHNTSAFLPGGWFLTGDIGRIDDEGYLTITDRKKDIIIRGGENISSREVEEALNQHPLIQECAAIASPDLRLGEKVCVYVVVKEGAQLTLEEITEHCGQLHLAKQKWPEVLQFIEQLPRNATGKIQKHFLRDRLKREE